MQALQALAIAAHPTLEEALRAVVPDGACVAQADARYDPGALMEAERPAVARAVAKRVAEFTGGRIAARRALAVLGIDPAAIPAAASRMPLWPPGVVGSISHSGGCCVAAVARADRHRSMGVDIEAAAPLAPHLWETVCTPAERDWLLSQPAEVRGSLAKVIFSAKESVYKWQYPLTRMTLWFKDVEIDYSPVAHIFRARFTRSLSFRGRPIRAVWGRAADYGERIVTAVTGE